MHSTIYEYLPENIELHLAIGYKYFIILTVYELSGLPDTLVSL